MAMYDDVMDPAFAGMKSDSGADRVESFPVGATTLGVGLVVGTDVNGLLVAGPGTVVRGITLHDHLIRGADGTSGLPVYAKTECASVMTRGLVWARVTADGAVTEDGPVKFAAGGTVGDAGASTLNNAVFRSGLVTVAGDQIARVELHNPFSETDTTTT